MKKLLAILVLLSVVLMNGCKKDDQVVTVGLCPLVVSTIPLDKAVNVPLNQVVSATFNEAMNPATITDGSFNFNRNNNTRNNSKSGNSRYRSSYLQRNDSYVNSFGPADNPYHLYRNDYNSG